MPERTIVIRCATGDRRVPCFRSGVPGLVIHPAGDEETHGPLWVLAHEPSGYAIARDHFFLGRGEARLAARGLAGLTDWTLPVDGSVPIEAVRDAFERATAWRTGRTEGEMDLVRCIGDRVIVRRASKACDGTWHRIEFGWGRTYVSLGTPRRKPPGPTVRHFSSKRVISSEGPVWSYDDDTWDCLDCGAEV